MNISGLKEIFRCYLETKARVNDPARFLMRLEACLPPDMEGFEFTDKMADGILNVLQVSPDSKPDGRLSIQELGWNDWMAVIVAQWKGEAHLRIQQEHVKDTISTWLDYGGTCSRRISDAEMMQLAVLLVPQLQRHKLSVDRVHQLPGPLLDSILTQVFGEDKIPRQLDHPNISWSIQRRDVYLGQEKVQHAMESDIEKGNLAFVNREDVIQQCLDIFNETARRRGVSGGSQQWIPIAEQCKGAGKTRLGPYLYTKFQEAIHDDKSWPNFNKEGKIDYVLVRFASSPESLQFVVAHQIIDNFFSGGREALYPAFRDQPGGLIALLQSLKRVLFLHLDEIGAILKNKNDYDPLKELVHCICQTITSDDKPVWPYLSGVLTDANSILDYSTSRSSFEYKPLALRTIRRTYFDAILEHTYVNEPSKRLVHVLPKSESFSMILWRKTCGNPREITRALCHVLNKKSKQDCLSALESFHVELPVFLTDFTDISYKEAVVKVFEAAISGTSINLNSRIPLHNSVRPLTYGHIVALLNLHWDGTKEHADIFVYEDHRDKIIDQLSQWKVEKLLLHFCFTQASIDFGKQFEDIILERMLSAFFDSHTFQTKFSSFFSQSTLGKCTVKLSEPFVITVPRVLGPQHPQKRIGIESSTLMCRKTISIDQIGSLLQEVLDLSIGSVLLKPLEKSHSFDLGLIIQQKDPKNPKKHTRQQQQKRPILVSFCAKNYSGESRVGFNTLIEEIAKCGHFSRTDTFQSHVVVIAATQYDNTYHHKIGVEDSLVINRTNSDSTLSDIQKQMTKSNVDELILLNLQSAERLRSFLGVDKLFLPVIRAMVSKNKGLLPPGPFSLATIAQVMDEEALCPL